MIVNVMRVSHIEYGDPLASLSTEEAGPDIGSEHGNLRTEVKLQRLECLVCSSEDDASDI